MSTEPEQLKFDRMREAAPQTATPGQWRDVGLTLVVCLLWAICYPLIDVAVTAAPPLKLAAWRALIAGLVILIPATWVTRQMPPPSVWPQLGLAGLMLTSLGFAGMFLAGGRMSPGLATVLTNVQPLLAALLGLAFLHEPLGPVRSVALLIGFAGVLTGSYDSLSGQSTHSSAAGVGFVFMGALGIASGNVLLKRISNQVSPFAAAGVQLTIGALPLFVLASLFESEQRVDWSLRFVLALSVLAVLGTALAMILWLSLLKRRDLIQINTLTFTTPLFGLLIGAFFFAERLSAKEWIGVGLIICAVGLISRTFRFRLPEFDQSL